MREQEIDFIDETTKGDGIIDELMSSTNGDHGDGGGTGGGDAGNGAGGDAGEADTLTDGGGGGGGTATGAGGGGGGGGDADDGTGVISNELEELIVMNVMYTSEDAHMSLRADLIDNMVFEAEVEQ